MGRVGQAHRAGLREEVVGQVGVAHPGEGLVADEVAHGRRDLIEDRGALTLQRAIPEALRPRLLGRKPDRDTAAVLVALIAKLLRELARDRLHHDALRRKQAVEHRVLHAGRGDEHVLEAGEDRGLEQRVGAQGTLLLPAREQAGVLALISVDLEVGRGDAVSERAEDLQHVVAVHVAGDAWRRSSGVLLSGERVLDGDEAAVGGPTGHEREERREEVVRLRKVQFLEHIDLGHLVHDQDPVGLPLDVGDQQEGGVGDEQDLAAIPRRVLEVGDDRRGDGASPRDGAAVKGGDGVGRRERLKLVRDGLGDEVLGRLDEENLVAAPGEPISMTRAGARLPGPSRGIERTNNHFKTIL